MLKEMLASPFLHRRRDFTRKKLKGERIIGVHKGQKEPIDYGVTKDEFLDILDKASQPTKSSKEEHK